jgi:acyl-coenzyme A synthetase/AMP-(fatty) acid ligase
VHVLDEKGAEAPIGEPGELYVGGAGVTRGYLGRPDLTAERYVPDPFSDVPGARLYRSGDSARRTPDGDVEYLGRLDHQVKIRGHRIEPAEIEAALVRHPAVREAVVLAGPDPAGGLRLVAYWVGRAAGKDDAGESADKPGPSELRGHLQQTLPDYMVPGVFLALDRLPLTANGKVDRAALPAADGERPELADAFAAPETPLEKALAEIWAGALEVDRIGIDDDFFELGGHSMLATQLVAETRERLGRLATVRLVFDEPTIRGFARALEERETAA